MKTIIMPLYKSMAAALSSTHSYDNLIPKKGLQKVPERAMGVSRGFRARKDSTDKNFSAWDGEYNAVKQNTSCKYHDKRCGSSNAFLLVGILKKNCTRCTCVHAHMGTYKTVEV